jgi:hypothetical protein
MIIGITNQHIEDQPFVLLSECCLLFGETLANSIGQVAVTGIAGFH